MSDSFDETYDLARRALDAKDVTLAKMYVRKMYGIVKRAKKRVGR